MATKLHGCIPKNSTGRAINHNCSALFLLREYNKLLTTNIKTAFPFWPGDPELFGHSAGGFGERENESVFSNKMVYVWRG